PLRPLLDPALDERDLARRELLARLARRHDVVDFLRRDALPELALRQVARNEGRLARLRGSVGAVAEIQAQVALADAGAVALDAVLGEDRADVPVELDAVGELDERLVLLSVGADEQKDRRNRGAERGSRRHGFAPSRPRFLHLRYSARTDSLSFPCRHKSGRSGAICAGLWSSPTSR